MSIISYKSENIENGMTFDQLVGNLLAYKPDHWGYTEQNFNNVGTDFGALSNNLYYLPAGNYRIENLPNSPFDSHFVNISIFDKNDGKFIICDIGGSTKYSTKLTSDGDNVIWSEFFVDLLFLHVGETPPENQSIIWIDTSKLIDENSASLKYYNGTEWVPQYIENPMTADIYDTQGIKKDPYEVIAEKMIIRSGEYIKFVKHKNNELELIHLTTDEADRFRNYMLTTTDIAEIFKENGDVYNQLVEYSSEYFKASSGYCINQDIIKTTNDDYSRHINEESDFAHITAEEVNAWDNKSPFKHTHVLDGKVTINSTDIVDSTGTMSIASEFMPGDAMERPTLIESIYNLASKPSDEDLAGKYHNGNILYTEDEFGNNEWYKIYDNSKFGKSALTCKTIIIGSEKRNWSSICAGHDIIVMISTNSNIFAYSTDGINWTEGSISDTRRDWHSICYGDGKFVAIAFRSNIFAYSTDGINWTEGSISDTRRDWHSICYGDGKFVAIAYSSSIFAYSTDGINWTEGSISDTEREWSSICYGDGKFVAIAAITNIFTYSHDGINWTEGSISDTEREWHSICYGDGKFVVIATIDTVFAYSTDGINWTEGSISDTEREWSSICYGDGKFVAIAAIDTVFAYSTDGITWAEVTTDNYADVYDGEICYFNGKFYGVIDPSNISLTIEVLPIYKEGLRCINKVINNITFDHLVNTPTTLAGYGIDDNGIASGEDFINLQNQINEELYFKYTPEGFDIDSLTDGDTIYPIYLGIQKTLSANGGGTSEYPMSTQYSDLDIILAVDRDGATTESVSKFNCEGKVTDDTSTIDIEAGLSMHSSDIPASNYFDKFYFNDIANPKWATDGLGRMTPVNTTVDNIIIKEVYSINGKDYDVTIRWDSAVGIVFDIFMGKAIKSLQDIHDNFTNYQDPMVFAIDARAKRIREMGADIVITEWPRMPTNTTWISVCYGDGKFVTIAQNTNICAYSNDGITWTQGVIGTENKSWQSVCYGNGKFVAVSSDTPSFFAYSTDGINWVTGNMPNDRAWVSVCYGNSTYVAIANESNTFAYSTDGINWTEVTISAADRPWISVCYGNDKFVAIAHGTHYFAYSTNGITWIEGIAGDDINSHWYSICYGNGKFVATPYSGTNFAYSIDGINWVSGIISNTTNVWKSVCYGNGKFISLGADTSTPARNYAYSTDGINWTTGSISNKDRIWHTICYGNDKYVAIEYNANNIAVIY